MVHAEVLEQVERLFQAALELYNWNLPDEVLTTITLALNYRNEHPKEASTPQPWFVGAAWATLFSLVEFRTRQFTLKAVDKKAVATDPVVLYATAALLFSTEELISATNWLKPKRLFEQLAQKGVELTLEEKLSVRTHTNALIHLIQAKLCKMRTRHQELRLSPNGATAQAESQPVPALIPTLAPQPQ